MHTLRKLPRSIWFQGLSFSMSVSRSLQKKATSAGTPREQARRKAKKVKRQASKQKSLLCKRHTMLPRQRLSNGVERGQALPPHGMAHHFGLLAHQLAAAWPCCSRLVPFCRGLSLCRRPLWQIYCCSRHLEWQPCHHGVSICSCREAGASTFFPAKPPSCHANGHSLTSGG